MESKTQEESNINAYEAHLADLELEIVNLQNQMKTISDASIYEKIHFTRMIPDEVHYMVVNEKSDLLDLPGLVDFKAGSIEEYTLVEVVEIAEVKLEDTIEIWYRVDFKTYDTASEQLGWIEKDKLVSVDTVSLEEIINVRFDKETRVYLDKEDIEKDHYVNTDAFQGIIVDRYDDYSYIALGKNMFYWVRNNDIKYHYDLLDQER